MGNLVVMVSHVLSVLVFSHCGGSESEWNAVNTIIQRLQSIL